MEITFGSIKDATPSSRAVCQWQQMTVVNPHMLIMGMSGSGKTYRLKKIINALLESAVTPPKVHIFDVHGDIETPITQTSTVKLSESSDIGINPLIINPDPHFGGVRKRIQSVIEVINSSMAKLGEKQQAVLRNLLLDLYAEFGFDPNSASTWFIDNNNVDTFASSINRVYLDVPYHERQIAASLGAELDTLQKCWYCNVELYNDQTGLTQWPPRIFNRRQPNMNDLLRIARHTLQRTFFATSSESIIKLNKANNAARRLLNARLREIRNLRVNETQDELANQVEKAKESAIDCFSEYVKSISTGSEFNDQLKYDSKDVLKSVVDRLENLINIGIFKANDLPFDSSKPFYRHDLTSLRRSEQIMFVKFRLSQLFEQAVERGETSKIHDIVILDEGHIFVDDNDENIINTIAKEARKFGLALIIASQAPTHFPDDFVSSVATKIVLGIDEMFWQSSSKKANIPINMLKDIALRESALIQIKQSGQARNDWCNVALS